MQPSQPEDDTASLLKNFDPMLTVTYQEGENEYAMFRYPFEAVPGAPWAHAKQVSLANAKIFFWQELSTTQEFNIMMNAALEHFAQQGWAPLAPLGPANITIRESYRWTNKWDIWAIIILSLIFFFPLAIVLLLYHHYKGYEPAGIEIQLRRRRQIESSSASA